MTTNVNNSKIPPVIHNSQSFTWKEYGFIIAMVVTIGAALAGVGVGAGALAPLKHIDAIIIMGASSGIILLGVIGGVGFFLYRNRPKQNPEPVSPPLKKVAVAPPQEDFSHLIYGKEAWEKLNVKIVEDLPPLPQINWDEQDLYFKAPLKDNYILFYSPGSFILTNDPHGSGTKLPMNLNNIKRIGLENFTFPKGDFTADIFDKAFPSGWKLISTKTLPESESKPYSQQTIMIKQQSDSFRMPYLIELCAYKLLKGSSPGNGVRCQDTYNGRSYGKNECGFYFKEQEARAIHIETTYNSLGACVCKDLN